MTSRIADVFVRLRADHRTGLVTYVTGGDPDGARSAEILRGLNRVGADVLEVGVPFSDPLADGPVIQRASERALAAGGNLSTTLDRDEVVLVNLSGRGDKDVEIVRARGLGVPPAAAGPQQREDPT